MITIKYKVSEKPSVWGPRVEILDEDAAEAVGESLFVGFTIEEAIRHANKKLAPFGYQLEDKER